MWFSRFANVKPIQLVQIQRIEDLFKQIKGIPSLHEVDKISILNTFLIMFPLSIACSIRVKDVNANFKPEYIIPQLLLQYISTNPHIDGITYLSTLIDYRKINDVPSYNYVFPVKNIAKEGFCSTLIGKFHLTSPTSLEMEELLNHYQYTKFNDNDESLLNAYIEIIDGEKSLYHNTAFGRLEKSLKNRSIEGIFNI